MLTSSTIIVRTLIALSRSNWLIIWIAIELNLISFIPLINSSLNFQETEASVKYLLVQALGSRLLIIRRISIWILQNLIYLINIVLLFSLLMKIGMAPCHLWYPSVITSVSWPSAIVLSTWQKLAPLSIMSFIIIKTSTLLIAVLAIINAITGGLIGMNQTHLRTIIAYSSITHMGWILALIYRNMSLSTIVYFMLYRILIAPIFYSIYKINSKTVSQINRRSNKYKLQYMFIPIIFLSLGGLPPLTGFFPKWITIYLISPRSYILLLFLIAGSLINLYFYLNIIFSTILRKSNTSTKWETNTKISLPILLFIRSMCLPIAPVIIL